MKFTWLQFDADNTLLDFNGASKASFWKSFTQFDRTCSEEIYNRYKKINHEVWTEFELGKINAITLRSKRFQRLFEALDWNDISAQEFSKAYLQNLILTSEAYDGVVELLQKLRPDFTLSIITNGLQEVQRPRIEKLKMTELFASIVVSDEIGVAKPAIAYFDYVYQSIPNPPPKSEILVIGDSLNSDIQGGNNFGVSTCWISNGKENNTTIQPNYTIKTVQELPLLLSS